MKKFRNLSILIASAMLLIPCIGNGDIEQIGPNLFAAGVPSSEFQYFAARQRHSNWCWAAAIQMVLNYHGLFVNQSAVVERIYGAEVDAPAAPDQILTALSGWAPDARGRFSEIDASPYTFSGSQIVQDLGYRWPIIVGLRTANGGGHAVVLTAVYYSVDPWNNPIFHSVVIRDPWPDSPSRQELSWSEFQQRLLFMAHVRVRRL